MNAMEYAAWIEKATEKVAAALGATTDPRALDAVKEGLSLDEITITIRLPKALTRPADEILMEGPTLTDLIEEAVINKFMERTPFRVMMAAYCIKYGIEHNISSDDAPIQ